MTKLHLAEGLSLPLDIVTEKLGWLGRTGSGKTYGSMKLAELMLDAGAQVGALDPVGVWRALRVPAEKGGRAYEVVVFGGLSGDLPLEPTPAAGELIADLVCERGLSFVLDVSQFIPAEQQRFVRAFADRFFHRKKAKPGAVHLFMEECQEFIPENPSHEEAKTLGVMQRLWKLGRNFGIGGSLISQRPQEVAKKALNMSGTLFCFQMTGPQERAAVKKWVSDHSIAVDIESVLQTLKRGAPHVEMFFETQAGAVYRHSGIIKILPRVTGDMSSTPKVGASSAAARLLTPIDIEKLRDSMAATIERAKADDPRELRRKIADLERALGVAAKLGPPLAVPKTVEKLILKDAQVQGLHAALNRIGLATEKLEERQSALGLEIGNLRTMSNEIIAALRAAASKESPVPRAIAGGGGPGAARIESAARPHRPAPVVPSSTLVSGLDDGAQRILDTVLMLDLRGITATRESVARWMGIHPRGGRYNTTLADLRARHLLNGMELTSQSTMLARETPTGPEALVAALPDEATRNVMRAILGAEAPLSRESLAEVLGIHPRGGRYNTALALLRTMGVIPERGEIVATDGARR